MNRKQLLLQRDLYKILLGGATIENDFNKTLTDALKIITELTGCRISYLEITNRSNEQWWTTQHCTENEVESIKKNISTGIIAKAIKSGKTISTRSAFLDERFQDYKSVQSGKIESVLCSPIKSPQYTGVIYLQGDHTFDAESEENLMEAEIFTRHITPLLKQIKYNETVTQCNLHTEFDLEGIIGESRQFISLLKQAMSIAQLDVTVLLNGETGTGKSQLAKVIHQNSARKNGPFIHINCANIPEHLVESELFGAVKGAHSSAMQRVEGKISAASNGTLFLDEIGELPIQIQAKLLQFIEDGIYFPLGSKVPESPNVRIITATNIDFDKAIEENKFRADLYYRICVFPLTLPPLKNRKEDLPHFTSFFVKNYCQKYNIPSPEISSQVIEYFMECNWPGNIRELQNKIQQALFQVHQESSPILKIHHFLSLNEFKENEEDISLTHMNYRDGKSEWEKEFIEKNLLKYDWNISKTADKLGLSRSRLNSLVKKYVLKREE